MENYKSYSIVVKFDSMEQMLALLYDLRAQGYDAHVGDVWDYNVWRKEVDG